MESLLFIALAAAILAAMFRPRPEFRVRIAAGKVRVSGAVPRGKAAVICEFFETQFPHVPSATVAGSRRDGRLRLTIRGRISRGECQQIRNFLLTVL